MSLTAFVFLNTRNFDMEAPEMPKIPEVSWQKIIPEKGIQTERNIGSGEIFEDVGKLIRDLLEASFDFNSTAKAEKPKGQSLDSNS